MKRSIMVLALALLVALLAAGCQKVKSDGNMANTPSPSHLNPATIDAGMQTVTTRFTSRAYAPITVQAGLPVRWTIQMVDGDLNGCNNAIQIPAFRIVQNLTVGETVVEFTPTVAGTYTYSCWMGMIRSKIIVVEDL